MCRLSAFRPHSSPDPFGATLPPGEGMECFDTQKACTRVTRETIRNEKWTVKLAGFVLKTIAPLL